MDLRLRYEMADSQAIGVIKHIAGGVLASERELFVFSDRLVLVSEALWKTWLRYFVREAGLIGMLVYAFGAKSRAEEAERRRQLSPEQLLASDPKGMQFLARDIIDAHLSGGRFEARLRLSMADGSTRKFSWVSSANKYEQVNAILRTALGTRLIDEKKAA